MNYLKEPLVHFCALGALLFVWFAYVAEDDGVEETATNQINVSPETIEVLRQTFATTWKRAPTDDEIEALIEDHITEEVLVREAYELGLARGDSVVRNRLRQKMTFLTTSVAQAATPDEAELAAFFENGAEQYQQQGQVAFEQVFLGDNPTQEEIESAIATLNSDEKATIGRSTLLPPRVSLTPEQAVDGSFGRGFFAQLQGADAGVWSGPYVSGYGAHIVRVTDAQKATVPAFEAVKERVLTDWRREKSEELSKAYVERLREKYEIVLPEEATTEEQAAQ
ncbi:peptidylprolyl isomerase [Roseovarius albus]|uniref:Parvulin-like PPIase n=1 Tax=Roseovarius albus TaxID=1247867 RepID=A0A1X6Z9P2_9RHOB|nr:peptidylprolyl isomerase [Roseovarius albus]SLN44545.1 peptidylprolyl isomerase [Roseovarius albus]